MSLITHFDIFVGTFPECAQYALALIEKECSIEEKMNDAFR